MAVNIEKLIIFITSNKIILKNIYFFPEKQKFLLIIKQ